MLCSSDDAQTFRIVARFNLEGGKTKNKPQTVVNSYLPLQEFQGLPGVDFRFLNFSSLFSPLFLLHCFDCTQTHSIVAYLIKQGAPVIKWTNLSEKNRFSARKRHRNGFSRGFHTILHEDASQFFCAAPMMLKVTG